MKKSKKILIIIAVCCIAVGILMAAVTLAVINFDLTRLNTMELQTVTYELDNSFSHIIVDVTESDVIFAPSEDGKCRVVCIEGKSISHTVSDSNGILKITRVDIRKWYERVGIYWGKMSVTVYLPDSEYTDICVENVSGDIVIPTGFSFAEAELYSTSGDVCFSGQVESGLVTETVSGDIYLSDIICGTADICSVSGNIKLTDCDTDTLSISSSSGDVELIDVFAEGDMVIDTVSGDIELYESDGANILLDTTSGDVKGRLMSEKKFDVSTSSGDVRVPWDMNSEERCGIRTVSGDIEMTVAK
ncbi:MAG: DUF4097 family beta strand repeat protein [Clostridia bacterium]|nr:DUF4097 family beta strand repeat protein [Clostridia bacterium]